MQTNIAHLGSYELWLALREIRVVEVYPAGSKLFQRGTSAQGVYFVDQGSVNLLWDGDSKGEPLFEMAGPGAVLGLAESMTGEAYRLTAEVSATSQISYVDRASFLGLMRQHPEFCMQVVRLLSENLHGLYFRFQSSAPVRKSTA